MEAYKHSSRERVLIFLIKENKGTTCKWREQPDRPESVSDLGLKQFRGFDNKKTKNKKKELSSD